MPHHCLWWYVVCRTKALSDALNVSLIPGPNTGVPRGVIQVSEPGSCVQARGSLRMKPQSSSLAWPEPIPGLLC